MSGERLGCINMLYDNLQKWGHKAIFSGLTSLKKAALVCVPPFRHFRLDRQGGRRRDSILRLGVPQDPRDTSGFAYRRRAPGLVIKPGAGCPLWVTSPPRWSSRAVVLFHYGRGSRSMERRHHYPSGLMRLSQCCKGQAITAAAVSQPADAQRGDKNMQHTQHAGPMFMHHYCLTLHRQVWEGWENIWGMRIHLLAEVKLDNSLPRCSCSSCASQKQLTPQSSGSCALYDRPIIGSGAEPLTCGFTSTSSSRSVLLQPKQKQKTSLNPSSWGFIQKNESNKA